MNHHPAADRHANADGPGDHVHQAEGELAVGNLSILADKVILAGAELLGDLNVALQAGEHGEAAVQEGAAVADQVNELRIEPIGADQCAAIAEGADHLAGGLSSAAGAQHFPGDQHAVGAAAVLGLGGTGHLQLKAGGLSGTGVGVGQILSDAQEAVALHLTLAQAQLSAAGIVHAALEGNLAHADLFHNHRTGGIDGGVVIDEFLGQLRELELVTH